MANMHRHLLSAETQLLLASPRMPLAEAKRLWMAYRLMSGFKSYQPITGKPGANHKSGLNALPTVTVTLASANSSGHNVCDKSGKPCRRVCVVRFTGRAGEPTVVRARVMRTRFLFDHPAAFIAIVEDELKRYVKKYGQIACRPNVASDLRWEDIAPSWFDIDGITFYDYTKLWDRGANLPANYHLTYSASEQTSDADIVAKVATGATVTAVFNVEYKPRVDIDLQDRLPLMYAGLPVVDGDASDERYSERGVIVGLRAKGEAIELTAGEREFVKVAQ
jgi:hypothetical protein